MTSQNSPKTITLCGGYLQHEAESDGAITPGMLVQRAPEGKVAAHGTAGGAASTAFAVEYGMTGRGISDDYADGEQVIYRVFAPGALVFAHLAAGDISEGDLLASAGDGMLREAADGEATVAVAAEDVDATGEPQRIRVEVMPSFVPANG